MQQMSLVVLFEGWSQQLEGQVGRSSAEHCSELSAFARRLDVMLVLQGRLRGVELARDAKQLLFRWMTAMISRTPRRV